jgi:mono/diheme cytochrome c family protein
MSVLAVSVLTLLIGAPGPVIQSAQPPPAPAPDLKVIARGKEVYATQKCQACHSIGGTGNKRGPLDGVGARLKESDVRQWIVAPRKMKATVRKPDYSRLPKADVDALVAYMMSLTRKP